MEMKDSRIIAAPRDVVFEALLSADMLKLCIPGAEEVTGDKDAGFDVVVLQKVGPVKARFKGVVSLEDVIPGVSLRLVGEGKGGVAGFAKGNASVSFLDHAEGTELSYEAAAKVGGKIAQLGSRIIDAFAKKMADAFFKQLAVELEAGEISNSP